MKDINKKDVFDKIGSLSKKSLDRVNKYYREIGLITNNPSSDCIYKIGADTCSFDKLNRYRLI